MLQLAVSAAVAEDWQSQGMMFSSSANLSNMFQVFGGCCCLLFCVLRGAASAAVVEDWQPQDMMFCSSEGALNAC
jgi:hypothetical protein